MVLAMTTDLIHSGQIPDAKYSYDEMREILDARETQRKARQAPPQRHIARGGTYFVVILIVVVVAFLYYWFTQGGGK